MTGYMKALLKIELQLKQNKINSVLHLVKAK